MTSKHSAVVIEDRWVKIQSLSLRAGSHNPDSKFCVMEAVAYVAGEKWSDSAECACPVIAAFLRSWNDSLPTDEDRDRLLKPLVPMVVGTRDRAAEKRRALMATDWLIRVHAPAWLRIARLSSQADILANLPEITETAQFPSILGPIEAVRSDAAAVWHAAWAAAWAPAGEKLAPTVSKLQVSAVDLVKRMIAVKGES